MKFREQSVDILLKDRKLYSLLKNLYLIFDIIYFFIKFDSVTFKEGGFMKRVIYPFIFLCVILFNACTNKDSLSLQDSTSTKMELIECRSAAELHSIVLECAAEIVNEQNIQLDQLTPDLAFAVTQDAVLRGTQKYISQKEGSNLTSTEQNTLRAEVSNYWYDSSNRNLMKRFSLGPTPNPNTGNVNLNLLYENYNIRPEVQIYFNKMLGNIDSSNYEVYLDNLVMEVWSRGVELSTDEKLSLIDVINVTKDSYRYWSANTPMTRMSRTAKGLILADAIGGVRGFFRGLGRSAGSLVFGPGGAVLTITGSVITNAASSSVEAAIAEGLLRI